MSEFEREAPGVYQAILVERDIYLTNSLQIAALTHAAPKLPDGKFVHSSVISDLTNWITNIIRQSDSCVVILNWW